MQVQLLVTNDKANVRKVVLRCDTLIGRSPDCNLRIASQEVSRKHCSILLTPSQVRIRDLGSANGTYLNGRRLQPNVDVPLPSGSELEIGNVRFVVQHDAPPPFEEPGSTVDAPHAELLEERSSAKKPPPRSRARQEADRETLGSRARQEADRETPRSRARQEADREKERSAQATIETGRTGDEAPLDDLADTVTFDFSENASSGLQEGDRPPEGKSQETPTLEPSSTTGKPGKLKSLFGFLLPKRKTRAAPGADAQSPAAQESAKIAPEPPAHRKAQRDLAEDEETVAEQPGARPRDDALETVLDADLAQSPAAETPPRSSPRDDEDSRVVGIEEKPAAENDPQNDSDKTLRDFFRQLSSE